MTESFRPVVYLKSTCPHCLKLRIFLLEAGLEDRFEQRMFTQGDAGEEGIRAELAPHFEKVTFPTAQLEAGAYMQESDAIIAELARREQVDIAALDIFDAYAHSVLPRYIKLRRDLAAARA